MSLMDFRGLSIHVCDGYYFAPTIDGLAVMLQVQEMPPSIGVELAIERGASPAAIAAALRAVARFFEQDPPPLGGSGPESLTVEKSNADGSVALVPSSGGWLKEDGVVEYDYGPPRK